MATHRFRIVNVFALAGQPFSGNPLCVFEDADGLTDEVMQALALQFNLSETTFVLPSKIATARVRIFMPHVELPFGGHPMLGSAHVVRELFAAGDDLTLETKAGVIPLSASGNEWTLIASSPTSRPVSASRDAIAMMLGLNSADLGDPPLWVNTGVEQMIVPVSSSEALQRCNPNLSLLTQFGRNRRGLAVVYVWTKTKADEVLSRFFFEKGSAVCEDPGTGSACANLGGWYLAQGNSSNRIITIHQGAQTGRNCRLKLEINREAKIGVSGQVTELGRGDVVV